MTSNAAGELGGNGVRPLLMAVDDDPLVLTAVERDLRARYGDVYQVAGADSGAAALEVLAEAEQRRIPVAAIVADQRMPAMTGVELLGQVKDKVPDVKTVLLTAYADTDAAIAAINSVQLDFYVMKPWDPPEEKLYPLLDDLLEDWMAGYRPPFRGTRLVGDRWSAESHRLRDFLARNQVPFQWLDVERSEEAQQVLAEAPAGSVLPLVVLPGGEIMAGPSNVDVAEAIGLHTTPDAEFFDLIVVGGGPGGLAAAVYGASEGLSTALIEREAPGGQAGLSSKIENYLGFPQGISGADLARRAYSQARRFGAEVISPREAVTLERKDPYRIVSLSDGTKLSCRSMILAGGVAYRRHAAEGVEALTGAGVYYGAAAVEALALEGEDVFVVGGANSAGQAALHFARFVRKVTLLVRGDSLGRRMSAYLVDRIEGATNVEARVGVEVVAVSGEGHLETVTIRNRESGALEELPARALFFFIGAKPYTVWLEGTLVLDRHGFVVVGSDLQQDGSWQLDRDPYLFEASIPGVFAVGDIRSGSVKRVASAVGEGSIAVRFVHQYLEG